MKKLRSIYFGVLSVVFAFTLFFACKGEGSGSDGANAEIPETLTSGRVNLHVDTTVQPIVEDVLAVFHSVYNRATIQQVNRTESEIVNALLSDSASVAVLPRMLTDDEARYFEKRKITPRVTPFATDAVAFVVNNKATDTLLDPEELYKALRGEPSTISKLVFDNPGSSTVQYLLKKANAGKLPAQGMFALNSNREVIEYVRDNNGAVGIVGVNWLVQPPLNLQKTVEDVTVMAVKNVKTDTTAAGYYKPSQTNIATGAYPFTRKLYLLNYQGKQGLGMGFATYISAREGQRIILKSGLLPEEIPPREINVRNEL
ncbi:substrate-binding domain-containing protein [Flavobacterium sp.]|uniref:PstS family phosphate ABC transporter substrate-binding protein n=1 Tax=Flavobacterium sp. TaxID=239 RepID=UPI0026054305|nr:substrate-binding domain-containing protein [Flavobacterium sp.]